MQVKRPAVLLMAALVVLVGAAAPRAVGAQTVGCASMTTPVLQKVNPGLSSSLLTTSEREAAGAAKYGYTDDQGTLVNASWRSRDGLSPVHRLYRSKNHDFVWTLDEAAVKSAAADGYTDEGVNFYAAAEPTTGCLVAVQSYARAGYHRLAVSDSAREALLAAGWVSEGPSFYAAPANAAAAPPVPPVPPVPGSPSDDAFSIAVLPDTQQEVLRASDTRFVNRSNWLVKNQKALNLRYVAHSGDVVNWDTPDHAQYQAAAAALKPLESAKIPFSLAVGNHDTAAVCEGGGACDPHRTRVLFRDTSTFNDYFTEDDFGAVQGEFEAGKVDNSYSTFTAGDASWMVLNLEMWPRPEAVKWAQEVVSEHPHHNVIVVTHYYLDPDGTIAGNDAGYGATSPQYLFDNLISQYPNIVLTFSGHTGTVADRVDTGVHGNKVYSFLQAVHSNVTNPTRLVTIDPGAKTLKTWVYSPYTDAEYPGSEVDITGLSLVH